ncbi:hypothetical protein IW262DRAFT_876760 [Armillaria fumosa]|nr:hypothetical protein IW262DRAFT_876760 [Armillaria fumosa]
MNIHRSMRKRFVLLLTRYSTCRRDVKRSTLSDLISFRVPYKMIAMTRTMPCYHGLDECYFQEIYLQILLRSELGGNTVCIVPFALHLVYGPVQELPLHSEHTHKQFRASIENRCTYHLFSRYSRTPTITFLPKGLQPSRISAAGFRRGSSKTMAAIKKLPPHDLPSGFFPWHTAIFAYLPPKLTFGWVTTGASMCQVLEPKAPELITIANICHTSSKEPVQVSSSDMMMKKIADHFARV